MDNGRRRPVPAEAPAAPAHVLPGRCGSRQANAVGRSRRCSFRSLPIVMAALMLVPIAPADANFAYASVKPAAVATPMAAAVRG
ncbi:hypothetical protein [Trinickia dinghuensis]|uniref:Uncharacterized protein n=1 Tax=Trinickia dinghuensis TaxID=2291023 RepID=A0A3D8JXW3_9BURK|nr:hypothetical protein [Trinickia dinghuensis]RDU97652.1 hypothetical protein DWV00_17415 [Trinickia dinghuensis]